MRVREMHPLCCISLECPGIERADHAAGPDFRADPALAVGGSEVQDAEGEARSSAGVAGVLYKWTNYGKGWRSRWFLLRNGVLSYSKTRRSETFMSPGEVRVIGTSDRRLEGEGGARKQHKTVGVVHLKISSFRESRSDDRRFYIFTGRKTLHLRTESREDRVAWIEALVSARSQSSLRPLNDSVSLIRNGVSISTEKLRDRLLEEGLGEELIKDCEKIMQSEFSGLKGQLKLLYEERLNLIDTLRQLEATSVVEASDIREGQFQLMKHENSSPGNEKYSECSATESSDDTEKQEFEELSDEEQYSFFDTEEYFSECHHGSGTVVGPFHKNLESQNGINNVQNMLVGIGESNSRFPLVERRAKLPDPVQKEKGVSLWSMIKDNVGKDLTRVCLPVYFNEPISSLQKCFEDMEYSYLLDQAYEYGKMGNSLMRILNVAAFAVSGYASSEGRHCKPFNPLLGETYEADFPERGIRFFSEKVSHHPMLIACHCEGKGWKFWGESNIRSKFWGRSIQLDPVGVLTLEFDDGEVFHWSKVTTTIYNLILGKLYCDHHGTMQIQGNRQYSCKLKFKEQTLLDRNPHQVQGSIEDVNGSKVATLLGKWDDSMYYILGEATSKSRGSAQLLDASLLWKRNKPPTDLTRYNLTSFAITLNELTPGLKEKLPPTDSRLRPDQRHLENGEYDKADAEKLRLERRQRMSRKLQESGWTPRWFWKDGANGPYRYIGGYWEAREQKKWNGCPNIFDDLSEYNESV